MLSTATIKKIAELLKLKEADISTAIKDEKEVDLTIDEKISVLNETELASLKSNSYKEGKKAGIEMEVDEIKKEMGLDFTGKSIKGLTEAIAKKTLEDAKIEPEKKVIELTEKLKTAQATANELQTKLQEKESEVSNVKTQTLILKELPGNTTLPQDKVLLLMKADGYDYKNEDGKIIWHKDGKALTDKLGNNLDTKTVATEYITTNKLSAEGGGGAQGGGRGAGDAGGSTATKLSDLKAKFTAEGKSLLGVEFSKAVQEAAKDAEFVMD